MLLDLPDLHRHLDGSIRPSTVIDLARRVGRTVPSDLAFRAGMGLFEALARFEFTVSLLQDPPTVRRVAAEICEDAARDGVATLEIRFAPQLHRRGRMEEFVDAAIEGIEGRAGLILCGLYGEPPSLLTRLVEIGATRAGVVGIDLAGGPARHHEFAMRDYAPTFRLAAERGLGRTAHAGEGRPALEIREAIEVLGVQRIGHGTTLLQDPTILELVVERGVTIEACLTSNVHTGAIASIEEHPLAKWLELGVRATLCTDNTLLSQVEASTEYERARALPGMSDALLARAIRFGHDAAFGRFTVRAGKDPAR